MAETVVQEEVFERAQDRAREERLRKAIEREMAAHRSLCEHYNKAIETIAEMEERESLEIRRLEEALRKGDDEILRLAETVRSYRIGNRKLVCAIVFFLFVFLFFAAYEMNLMSVVASVPTP